MVSLDFSLVFTQKRIFVIYFYCRESNETIKNIIASFLRIITKITRPCNVIPLHPTFIWYNWGIQGLTFFSFEAVLTCTHNLYFRAKIRKILKMFI